MATVGYGQNISQAPLRINVAPAEDALVVDISGETYPRWALKGSGSIALSAGTIAPDAGIRRDGTGIVAITDGSNGYGDLFIRNTLAFSGTGPYKVRSETSNDLTLETTMANAIVFSTAQTPRWNISSSGHLLASTDNAYDIGSADTNRVRDLYQTGIHFFRPADITSNRDILSVRVGSEANPRHKVLINTAGQLVFQSGPGGTTAPTDAFYLNPSTTDVVAFRRTIFADNVSGDAIILRRGDTIGNSISFMHTNTGGYLESWTLEMQAGDQAPAEFFAYKRPGGVATDVHPLRLSMDGWVRLGSYHWNGAATPIGAYLSGHLYAWADAIHDIGASANRFRDGYFANLVSVRTDQGDYGGNFATYTPPAGREGAFLFAVDTNTTNPGRRMYVYLNGAWRYVNLS